MSNFLILNIVYEEVSYFRFNLYKIYEKKLISIYYMFLKYLVMTLYKFLILLQQNLHSQHVLPSELAKSVDIIPHHIGSPRRVAHILQKDFVYVINATTPFIMPTRISIHIQTRCIPQSNASSDQGSINTLR